MKKNTFALIFLFTGYLGFGQEVKLLTNSKTDSVLSEITANLNQKYFDKQKASNLAIILKKKQKAGEFYNMSADSLGKKLTQLLKIETNDIHFYVGTIKTKNNVISGNVTKNLNFNGGFTEVKILNNNVGYIKWDRCIADDSAFKKIKSALIFLEGVDKLIIDISNNPGGDGRSSGYINQHLFEDTQYQDLLIKKCTGEDNWYQSEVPYNYSDAPKFYKTPLYILVSKKTGSAAEYFAFIAQEMKRATILGQTTAGAGNPVTMVSISTNFFMYVPICEIKTNEGKSIEAIGVKPDVILKSDNWIAETLDIINK